MTALAESPPNSNEQHKDLEALRTALVEHRTADSIALADKIIAETEATLKDEKRVVFSGQTLPQTLLDMGSAAAKKADAVDVGAAYGFAYFAKGFTLEDIGHATEAGPLLDRAVTLSPFNAQFLCEDGYWHAHNRDPVGALKLYKECVSYSGIADEAHRNRWKAAGLRGQGFVLIDLGKLDEAESRYKESLTIEPNDAHALNDLRFIAQKKFAASQPH